MTDDYYYRPSGPPPAQYPDATSSKFLDVAGRNYPLTVFTLIQGSENAPALAHQGDERTGLFWDGIGRLGVSVLGKKRYVLSRDGIEVWDNSGVLVGSIFLPDPVSVSGGSSDAALATNSVGGTEQPTTATQTGWLKFTDSAGVVHWVPSFT